MMWKSISDNMHRYSASQGSPNLSQKAAMIAGKVIKMDRGTFKTWEADINIRIHRI